MRMFAGCYDYLNCVGGCCDYQKDTYLHEGRFTGITVEEYALMLIDFKEGENMKKLNWIKVSQI